MKIIRLVGVVVTLFCAGIAQAETVNINTADVSTIADVLAGVGPAKAQAIVAYRQEHGDFESVDELTHVQGIGPATLKKNIDNIILSMTVEGHE